MEVNLTRWESLGADLNLAALRQDTRRLDHYPTDVVSPFPDGPGDHAEDRPPLKGSDVLLVILRRAFRRFGKGFAVGTLLQSMFTVSKLVLRRGRRDGRQIKRPFDALCLKEAFEFGSFVGTFLSVFEVGMLLSERDALCAADEADGDVCRSRLAIVLAGAAAGLSLLLAPASSRVPLSVFFGIRSLEVACHLLVRRGIIPEIPHADVLLMSLSSGQITWAWMFNRASLDPVFARFLDTCSARNRPVWDAYRGVLEGRIPLPDDVRRAVNADRFALGYDEFVDSQHTSCDLLHPRYKSCTWANIVEFVEGSCRSIPLYVPVYCLPLIFFRTRQLLAAPLQQALQTLLSIVRSSMFVGAYMALGWTGACLLRAIRMQTPKLTGLVTGLFAGCALFIEKPSRRIELALYTLSHALQSAAKNACWSARQRGLRLTVPGLDVLGFSLSSALLCYTYVFEPTALRRGYMSLMKWLIGSGSASLQASPGLQSPARRNS
ncbi:Transmembrane protein 135 N-terminal domain-containing protein [Plasmodiophora brassicae]|uniref:Transmembrane protein 135 N-terminal domain-containing protein n=1 Tax=Plasmodiophora brassicae TaxID=37360 RepID=A0A3P3Y5J1_PLABS|nr:unnamed protein product [Plasmodiophora brassicae]